MFIRKRRYKRAPNGFYLGARTCTHPPESVYFQGIEAYRDADGRPRQRIVCTLKDEPLSRQIEQSRRYIAKYREHSGRHRRRIQASSAGEFYILTSGTWVDQLVATGWLGEAERDAAALLRDAFELSGLRSSLSARYGGMTVDRNASPDSPFERMSVPQMRSWRRLTPPARLGRVDAPAPGRKRLLLGLHAVGRQSPTRWPARAGRRPASIPAAPMTGAGHNLYRLGARSALGIST